MRRLRYATAFLTLSSSLTLAQDYPSDLARWGKMVKSSGARID